MGTPGEAAATAHQQMDSASRYGEADEGRFERLFRGYSTRAWGFFRRRGFSADECGDLVQETFYQTYRSLPQFRGRSSFDTWFFHLAANVYRKELRRRAADKRRGQEISWDAAAAGPTLPEPTGGPDRQLLAKEQRQELRQAVVELPPQMRRCVLLGIDHGLSPREIADELELSMQTVKVHLFRARRRLRELLKVAAGLVLLLALPLLWLRTTDLQHRLKRLSEPRLNTPIEVLRTDSDRGEPTASLELRLPANALSYTLVLTPPAEPLPPSATGGYSLELAAVDGTLLWRGEGLTANRDGSFTVTLSRASTPPGKYHLGLFEHHGGEAEHIASYAFQIGGDAGQ